jgi:hypothetical protein
MRYMLWSRMVICAGAVIAGLAMIACVAGSSITPNPSPSATPPVITWNIYNSATSTSQQASGNQSIALPIGGQYVVTVHAQTPSGPQTLSVSREASWDCIAGNVGQNMSATFNPDATSQAPNTTGQVGSDLALLESVDLRLRCNSGYSFASGSYTLAASAQNFANQTTSATLTLNVTS